MNNHTLSYLLPKPSRQPLNKLYNSPQFKKTLENVFLKSHKPVNDKHAIGNELRKLSID